MASRQSIGFVTACISGGANQPCGVVSSPHSMGQCPMGAEVLVLRWRAGAARMLLLAAKEVERLGNPGVVASIM